MLRKYIAGPNSISQPSGTSAFRFLIPVDVVLNDPKTAHFVEREGELRLLYGPSRRIVIYPCRNNSELNFVCLHPDGESESDATGWNQSASKQLVLKVFDEYPEEVKALLSKAESDSIKLWKLLDLPALTTVSSQTSAPRIADCEFSGRKGGWHCWEMRRTLSFLTKGKEVLKRSKMVLAWEHFSQWGPYHQKSKNV